MSRIVSEHVNYAKERGESIERVVKLYENTDTVSRHNPKKKTVDMKTRHTGRTTAGDRCYNLAVVCVLLLCFLLLTAATVLWVKFSILNTELDKLQITYNTLILERDQLQTSFKHLTLERNHLWMRNMQMSLEKDHLKARNNNLTVNRDEQEAKIKNLKDGMELLQEKNVELQNKLNTSETQERLRWKRFGSSMYYISMMNWTESRQECISRGADLVIINTKDEEDFINNHVGKGRAWIGMSDQENENQWKWVDGTPVTTQYWNKNEPNNADDEDCGEVYEPYDINCWNDRKCSSKAPWICEKKAN